MNTLKIGLADYLLTIRDKKTMNTTVLNVLLSIQERSAIENRMEIIQLVNQEMRHREIAKKIKGWYRYS